MGREDKLKETILEIDEQFAPSMIAIVATCITSVIGLDLEGIAEEMQGFVHADLFVFSGGGFRGFHWEGKEEVLAKLTDYYTKDTKVLKDIKEVDRKRANIIGVSAEQYNHVSDVNEIKRMLNLMNIDVNTVLTGNASTEDIKKLGNAEMNIVLNDTGISAAELLKERFGTPWLYGLPIGIRNTVRWCNRVCEITNQKTRHTEIADELKKYGTCFQTMKTMNFQEISVGISGANEYVIGLAEFIVNECNLRLKAVVIQNSFSKKETIDFINGLSENTMVFDLCNKQTHEIIQEMRFDIFFGNVIEFNKINALIKISASFPGQNYYSFYNETPYAGFKGNAYLVQTLLNHIHDNLGGMM
jgi:nitrogenase molybdenum-cofactor synthesis protein NifE